MFFFFFLNAHITVDMLLSHHRRTGDFPRRQRTGERLGRCLLPLRPHRCSDDLGWRSAPPNATGRHSGRNLEARHEKRRDVKDLRAGLRLLSAFPSSLMLSEHHDPSAPRRRNQYLIISSVFLADLRVILQWLHNTLGTRKTQ